MPLYLDDIVKLREAIENIPWKYEPDVTEVGQLGELFKVLGKYIAYINDRKEKKNVKS